MVVYLASAKTELGKVELEMIWSLLSALPEKIRAVAQRLGLRELR